MCISICSVSQSCPTLCDLMDCSPPGSSSVHGILQARILEWVVISFSWRSSPPRIEFKSLTTPALAAGFFFFTTGGNWEVPYVLYDAGKC